MTEGLRSKIEATAREEIRRYMDPGYREKRMLEQGNFAGLVAFLKQRARLLRRMAWVLTVGYPLFAYLCFMLDDIVALGFKPAVIQTTVTVAGIALMNAVFVKFGLTNIVRTERCLAYLGMLTETAGEDSGSGVHSG